MLVFVVALAAGGSFAPAHPAGFALYAAILAAVLITVCLCKGESPRWRWGEKDRLTDKGKK
jgi:hypothetical protein